MQRIWKNVTFLVCSGLFVVLGCSSPNGPAKEGFTAKEAEQLASTRAIEIWGNPVLAMIETPEQGGGVDRSGRLARGIEGKWAFGYVQPGLAQALVVEVQGTRTYEYSASLAYVGGLQEILPGYLDSPEAMKVAERNGGQQLTNVHHILCRLVGEAIWPRQNPREVAWAITYVLEDSSRQTFYIEAYTGKFLGKK